MGKIDEKHQPVVPTLLAVAIPFVVQGEEPFLSAGNYFFSQVPNQ